MDRGNPAGIHYQRVWQERAADPSLPDWLRVASIAYGKHRANGHANFPPGGLALVLSAVDRETGELRRSENVSRAVRAAVRYGFLARGSRARCLIVPGHAVAGGLGNEHEQCREHGYAGND